MQSNTSTASNEAVAVKGFYKQYIDGDFGLKKTFWLYGVLGTSVLGLATALIGNMVRSSPAPVLIALALYTTYAVFLFIATWNAARRDGKQKVLGVVARLLTGLELLRLAVAWINIIQIIQLARVLH